MNRKTNILVTESADFSPRAVALLRQVGEVILADFDRQNLLSAVSKAEVLWVRLRHQIDAEIMAAAPHLSIIVSPTTGLNHIDLNEAIRRGIHVMSLRGETEFLKDIRATAEHTVALIFALLRHIPAAVTHVQAGGWNRDRFKGRELHEKTIGVVGYGRLGRIVARYLQVFDTRVLTADPHVHPEEIESGITLVPLFDLLRESDLVTLHVNLDEATWQFFDAKHFAVMKPGAWFINTSRGELVDEEALLQALRSGRLAGAAVDVLCAENSSGMANHPLVSYAREQENLIITPHIGGCTVESMEKTEYFLATRLFDFLTEKGKGLSNS